MREYTKISYTKENGVATITKTNPEDYYCTSREQLVQIRQALEDADADDSIRVIVMDSESGMHGGATALMDGMAEPDGEKPVHIREFTAYAQGVTRLMETMEKPIVGVIKKMAMGGGLELMNASDFVIAADDAEISLPEVAQDAMATWGGTQRVTRMLNWRKAKKVLLLGLTISGKEAAELDFVTESAPEDQVDERVQWYIDRIKSLPAYGLAYGKTVMRAAWEMNLQAGLMYEQELGTVLLSQGHFKEIVQDMIAGRESVYKPMVRLTNGPLWK